MSEGVIKLNDLIFAWEDDSPGNAYYLDTDTGDIKLVQRGLIDLDDLTDEIEQVRERYLYIPKPDKALLRKDLEDFVNKTQDQSLKPLLPIALEAPDPAFALRKILEQKAPGELASWTDFKRQRVAERIKRWLQANFVSLALDDNQA